MRELEALTGVAEENKQVERERKMAVRYHKVKFFERVKLTRAMEKLEKDHPEGERSEAVEAELRRRRVVDVREVAPEDDDGDAADAPHGTPGPVGRVDLAPVGVAVQDAPRRRPAKPRLGARVQEHLSLIHI